MLRYVPLRERVSVLLASSTSSFLMAVKVVCRGHLRRLGNSDAPCILVTRVSRGSGVCYLLRKE